MKWRREKDPSDGQIRVVKRFAIFPVSTFEGYWVWLQYYWREQRYWDLYSRWVTKEDYLEKPNK